VEFGEYVIDAAKREAKEEVGIEIKPLGILSIYENIPLETSHRHFIIFNVIGITTDEIVKIDNAEVSEYMWAPIDKATTMIHNEAYKSVIEEYIKLKQSGEINSWLNKNATMHNL